MKCADVSVPEVAVQRMKLDERRIDTLIEGIRQVATMDDPIGRTLCRTEIAQVPNFSCRVDSCLPPSPLIQLGCL
jgi:gamma-glutamyl phosphate reductase